MKTYDPGTESTAGSLAELRDQLDAPRAFWLMVPSGEITEETFQELLPLAEPGDTIVDGGNSNFRDSQRRHAAAAEQRRPLPRRRRLGRRSGASSSATA